MNIMEKYRVTKSAAGIVREESAALPSKVFKGHTASFKLFM